MVPTRGAGMRLKIARLIVSHGGFAQPKSVITRSVSKACRRMGTSMSRIRGASRRSGHTNEPPHSGAELAVSSGRGWMNHDSTGGREACRDAMKRAPRNTSSSPAERECFQIEGEPPRSPAPGSEHSVPGAGASLPLSPGERKTPYAIAARRPGARSFEEGPAGGSRNHDHDHKRGGARCSNVCATFVCYGSR